MPADGSVAVTVCRSPGRSVQCTVTSSMAMSPRQLVDRTPSKVTLGEPTARPDRRSPATHQAVGRVKPIGVVMGGQGRHRASGETHQTKRSASDSRQRAQSSW